MSDCGTACLRSHCEPFLVDKMRKNHSPLNEFCITAQINAKTDFPAFTSLQFTPPFTTEAFDISSSQSPAKRLLSVCLATQRSKTSCRILTACPSATPLWPHLRHRLTRRGRTSRRKPWAFGGWDSHPSSTLLKPAFSLLIAPPDFSI